MNANCVTTNAVCVSQLTPRNRQVLELVAEGMSNQEIADRLGLKHRTIKGHVYRAGLLTGTTRNRLRLVAELYPVVGEFTLPQTIHLTPRERQLLELIVRGFTYQQVAKEFGTTVGSVKTNIVRDLFDKTGMSSKSEVAAWYRAHCVPAQ